ncbi:hypothetical protein [Gimesia chilikensis]|uniref:hypothetical protein n=1 Tax=Gimesia chilikensis TaxID=2605989 RepID=UPI003A906528
MDDYVISQVSWHTRRTKRKAFHESAYLRMKTIVEFLQAHGLLRTTLLTEGQSIDEEFCFKKSDLTDEGFQLIQGYYDKWLNGHDRGKAITDTTILERGLKKLRNSSDEQSRTGTLVVI